jgi:hypothetical protein
VKHTAAELSDSARLYYPPDVPSDDETAYMRTEPYRRLEAARIEAGAQRGRWRAMMARLGEQLPGWAVFDKVGDFSPQSLEASYDGSVGFPEYTGPKCTGAEGEDVDAILAAIPPYEHEVEFRVSFLMPYYVVYYARLVPYPEWDEAVRQRREKWILLGVCDDPPTVMSVPRQVVKPEVLAEYDRYYAEQKPATRRDIRFDFSPEEQPCAAIVAREIEATYGYEPMPPEVGHVIVPDVRTDSTYDGKVTLYDCFFAESF